MSENINLVFGVGADDNNLEKGIYTCSWNQEDRTAKLWKRLGLDGKEDVEGGQTPRVIKCVGDKICAATRGGIFVVNRAGVTVEQRKLEDLFPPEDEDEAKKLTDKPTAKVGMLFTESKSLFVSLSLPSKDKAGKPIYLGRLLYSPNGNLDQLKPLPNKSVSSSVVPSSAPVYYNHRGIEKVLIPSQNHLETIILNKGLVQGSGPHYPTKDGPLDGNILSVSTAGGIIVCTDDKDGYLIVDERGDRKRERYYRREAESDFLLDDNCGEYLPSEATASLVTFIDNKAYVLMGMNDGILGAYEIYSGAGYPKLLLRNMIQLISDWKSLEVSRGGGPIYGLKEHIGYLQFTMRNLYFRMSCRDVLNPQKSIITEEEENQKPVIKVDEATGKKEEDFNTGYLSILEQKFEPRLAICGTPHRISCWDNYNGGD